jgi:hypothetical protein
VRRLRAALISVTLIAVAIAYVAAPHSPALGQKELRSTPYFVALPTAIIWITAELLVRLSPWKAVGYVATLALAASTYLAMTRLWLGYWTPENHRNINAWHLWPFFTAFWITLVGGTCLLVAAIAAVTWRYRMRRQG